MLLRMRRAQGTNCGPGPSFTNEAAGYSFRKRVKLKVSVVAMNIDKDLKVDLVIQLVETNFTWNVKKMVLGFVA